MLWVPASRTDRPTPACWRYSNTGPVTVVPVGQIPLLFEELSEHSTYVGLLCCRYARKLGTELKMNRLFANPMNVCTEFTRLNSPPTLKKCVPLENDTLSSSWTRVS